jgi:hypothetical protein
MDVQTKFLWLRKPAELGGRLDGWLNLRTTEDAKGQNAILIGCCIEHARGND